MQFTSSLLSALALGALAVWAVPVEKRDSHTGLATWYRQDGTTGSCGTAHSDSSKVIAVANSYGLSLCGKKVSIEYQGKKTEAVVADTCPECADTHIDLSRGAFQELAAFELGEMTVKWTIQ